MGKYNKRCFLQDGYAEHVQIYKIFRRQIFVVLSLRFLFEAQNFSVTPRSVRCAPALKMMPQDRTQTPLTQCSSQPSFNPISVSPLLPSAEKRIACPLGWVGSVCIEIDSLLRQCSAVCSSVYLCFRNATIVLRLNGCFFSQTNAE